MGRVNELPHKRAADVMVFHTAFQFNCLFIYQNHSSDFSLVLVRQFKILLEVVSSAHETKRSLPDSAISR